MKLEVASLEYSSRPKGEILRQEPSAENMAAEGSAVKVVISAGPETITVPDVSGWNYQHAKLYLEALGFKVDEMRVVSDTVDIDLVESVSEVGKQLELGSTVTIRVSNTKKTTTTTPTTTTVPPTTTTTERGGLWPW